MRAADVAEKVTAKRPDPLRPHARRMLELAATDQQEVRWHVAESGAPAMRARGRRLLAMLEPD